MDLMLLKVYLAKPQSLLVGSCAFVLVMVLIALL